MKINSKKYPQLTFDDGIWRGPAKKYSDADCQLGTVLLECLKRSPDFVGQIDAVTGEKDTFRMMMDRSVRCALWLKKQKLGPEDVISLSTDNHFNTVIPLLACFYVGLPVNTFWIDSIDEDSINYFTNFTEPKIIFANKKTARLVQKYNKVHNKSVKIVSFDSTPGSESFDEILKEQNPADVQNFKCEKISNLDATALILFTSGTTGHPKALALSYRHLAGGLNWLPREELDNGVGMWSTKIGWITAILAFLATVKGPSTSVVQNDLPRFEFCKAIEKYNINWMMLGARHVNMISDLSNAKEFNFSSVKFIALTGSSVKSQVEQNLRIVFPNVWFSPSYGITEVGGITWRLRDGKFGSCGIPVENAQVKLIDADGHTITVANKIGEFCAKPPYMEVRYYKNPVATKAALDADGWYHSGDMGYIDEDGEAFFVERIKEFIRFRIDDIPPGDIEELILKHPGVAEVTVVAKPHDEDIERPIAFIVKKSGAQVTEEEIQELVAKNLPDRMKLRGGVIFLDEMPYSTSGKLLRRDLRNLAKRL